MLDHILYQKENFHMYESLSGPVDEEWLKTHQIEGAPSQHLPSDHFPLAAKLALNPSTSSCVCSKTTCSTKTNKYGLKGHPCLIPALCLLAVDSVMKSSTLNCGCLYVDSMTLHIFSGPPNLCSAFTILFFAYFAPLHPSF